VVLLYVQIVYKNHHIADVIIKKIVVRFQVKKYLKGLITNVIISLYDILNIFPIIEAK